METVPTSQTSPPGATSPKSSFLLSKAPSTVSLAVALLLFLLPFVEIRCNGVPMARNTGINLVTGGQWQIFDSSPNSIMGGLNSDKNDFSDYKDKDQPNKFAIAALGLGALAFIIALVGSASAGKTNAIICSLAAIALIVMFFDLRSKLHSDTGVKSPDLGVNEMVGISLDGTPAFYFSVILFLLAGFLSWRRGNPPSIPIV